MADLRFHNRSQSQTLAAIAAASECTLADPSSADFLIDDVAPLDSAGPSHLSFLDNPKYKDQFAASSAGACIVSEQAAAFAPAGMKLLIAQHPYRSYALAATLFYKSATGNGIVEDTALIGGKIGKGCSVGHHAVIGQAAEIGDHCTIGAGTVIGDGVVIGDGTWIGPNVTVTHALVGKGVRIYTGARIGQEGFGFAMGPKGHVPVPQLGRVVIEDGVHIGANCAIDRGAGPDTVIGAGCVLDNLVQIAHNVRLGRGCVIAAQVGISGSTTLGDFVVMGGQSGVAGHLTIGTGVRIAAQSGVTKDIPAGEEWVGFPAAPRRAYWREQVLIKKLLGKKD